MGRRMRCCGCGRACDNFSPLMQKALAAERLCVDCETSTNAHAPSVQPADAPPPPEQQDDQEQQGVDTAHDFDQHDTADDYAAQETASRPQEEVHDSHDAPGMPDEEAQAGNNADEFLKEGRYMHPDDTGYFAFSLEKGDAYYTQATPNGAVEYFGTFVEGTLEGSDAPVVQVQWERQVTWEGPNDDEMEGFEAAVDQRAQLDVSDRGLSVILRGTKFYHESVQ